MGRPEVISGITPRYKTPCGYIYVVVNSVDGNVKECFPLLGKSGTCSAAMLEALSKVITLAMRAGVEKEAIIRKLKGILCANCDNEEWHSCPNAIAKALEVYDG